MLHTTYSYSQNQTIKNLDFTSSNSYDQETSLTLSPGYLNLSLKFTKSLADTFASQQELSRSPEWTSHKENDSTSISEFTLSSEQEQNESQALCEQFHQQGYCLKGIKCPYLHSIPSQERSRARKKMDVLKWIISQTPQILIMKKQRIGNFLA